MHHSVESFTELQHAHHLARPLIDLRRLSDLSKGLVSPRTAMTAPSKVPAYVRGVVALEYTLQLRWLGRPGLGVPIKNRVRGLPRTAIAIRCARDTDRWLPRSWS